MKGKENPMIEKYAVKFETKLRLAAQIASYISTGIAMYAGENNTAKTVTLVCSIVVTAYTFWKNNSFTQAAIKADQVLEELKSIEEDIKDGIDDIKESDC